MKKVLTTVLATIGVIGLLFFGITLFADDEDEDTDGGQYTEKGGDVLAGMSDEEIAQLFYERYGFYPEDFDDDEGEYSDDDYDSSGYDDEDEDYDDEDYEEYAYDDEEGEIVVGGSTGGGAGGHAQATEAVERRDQAEGAKSITLMLYLCGSDLESNNGCAVSDINDILKANPTKNVTIVMETGGSTSWHGYSIPERKLGRYVIKGGKIKKVGEKPLASMGDPNTLADFISWAAKTYPADRYMIDFWDHGSGSVTGICYDEHFQDPAYKGKQDTLLNFELRDAFSQAGVQFDTIIFDTCLSATVEIADALKDFGNYMLASEEVVLSGCIGYTKMVNLLESNPAIPSTQFGKTICDAYMQNLRRYEYLDNGTMSFIDLSKISHVVGAWKAMAARMTEKTQDVRSFRSLVRENAKAIKYGSHSEREGYTNLVDLGDLAQRTAREAPNEANSLKSAIKNAVVYEAHGAAKKESTGLAVYYPVGFNGDTDLYAENVDNRPYLQYLDAILDDWDAPSWVHQTTTGKTKAFTPVKRNDYKLEYGVKLLQKDDNAYFALDVKSGLDIVDTVAFNLYMYDDESKELWNLGSDNQINGDWEKGEFYDNFQATWMAIDGNFINAELIEEGEDYNIYSVPIELNGKDTSLRLKFDGKTQKYTALGCYDGLDGGSEGNRTGGAAAKGMRKLKNGDKIKLVYLAASIESEDDDVSWYTGEEIVWTGKNEIADIELNPGTYFYEWQITDIFGNEERSDLAQMEYDGESVSLSLLNDDEDEE